MKNMFEEMLDMMANVESQTKEITKELINRILDGKVVSFKGVETIKFMLTECGAVNAIIKGTPPAFLNDIQAITLLVEASAMYEIEIGELNIESFEEGTGMKIEEFKALVNEMALDHAKKEPGILKLKSQLEEYVGKGKEPGKIVAFPLGQLPPTKLQ